MRYKTFAIALGLFLLALAVRIPQLDAFFTADEFLWVSRSQVFLGGLLSPDFDCLLPLDDQVNAVPGQGLACTLRTGHPGVVTTWTGALGIILQWLNLPAADTPPLLEFVRNLPTEPVDQATIAPVRLPTTIITSLFVVLFFLLLQKLFKTEIAALAALLLALNPFHIALSRVIHHDALSTSFIITSALCLIIYFGVERRRRWLFWGGVLGGLAMLTKSTGLFLIPYAGLLALWAMVAGWARGEGSLGRLLGQTITDGLIWAATVSLSFVLFWPAMWVIPGRALHTIYAIGFKYASGGHAKGVLFFDNISRDPGPLFYPAMWFFRTNFWSMLGVLAAAVLAVIAIRQRRTIYPRLKGFVDKLSPRGFDDKTGLLLWISAFLFFFLIAMTVGEKKQDRYVLPIYPMLDLIAAAGLLTLVRQVVWRRVLFGLVLVVNLALILPRYPYGFTYYNPLAGGIRTASQQVTIGWGEGLDLAADYLNQKADAEDLKVATWYGSTFAPFFKGETIRYSDQKGNALGGDYVVFYINQRQRHFPDDELWQYINDNFSLEHMVVVDGVDYVWIFDGPGLGHFVEDQRYSGIAELLGWNWSGPVSPDNGSVAAGSTLPYSLFWEYLGKTPEEDFFLRLMGPDGRVWAESTSQPTPEFAAAESWRPNQIIEEQGQFHIPSDMPPGTYTLAIGFYTSAPAVTEGELLFPTLAEPMDEPLQTIDVVAPRPVAYLAGEPLADLQLLSDFSPAFSESLDKAGEKAVDALDFDLTWAALQPTDHAYQAAFALIDEAGVARWEWPARPLIEFLPTSAWLDSRPLRSQWRLPLDARTPGGAFTLALRLSDEAGQVVVHQLGMVEMPGRVRDFSLPAAQQDLAVTFGQAIDLVGLDLSTTTLEPNQPLDLTLYWRPVAPIDEDYTVFMQLLGPDGQVQAQQDKLPLDGAAPTATWTLGEIITDRYLLSLPDNLPPGEYRLIAGFYQFESSARLMARQDGTERDFAVLQVWQN